MTKRLEVRFRKGFVDARAEYAKSKMKSYLDVPVTAVERVDVYTIDAKLGDAESERVRKELFTDPVTQESSYSSLPGKFDCLIEVGFLPGVKDNAGATSQKAIEELLKTRFREGEAVYTSRQFRITGGSRADAERIAKEILGNDAIEHSRILSHAEWGKGMDAVVPKVKFTREPTVREIDLNISDDALMKLSADRSLALSLKDMHTIRGHFADPEVVNARKAAGLSDKVTDVELEVLAQTQSEHCKHRVFNAKISLKDENNHVEVIDSLFDTYVKRSSKEIEAKKDWIVSMFWDNAGVARLNEDWNYVVKCETHNSPSAIDPYGGSITGIVGVYRDPMGTGIGSKIVAGTYGFCTASPFYKGSLRPRMAPKRLLEGIIEGVKDGGNKSGIPTPYGIAFFDEGWIGKPLVYVAAIGIMPREVNGWPSHEKEVKKGDAIVMVGGRVGKDGIHGATESSLEHGGWITAGHVQIGDPFTQKKVQDFLLEARDAGLYHYVTDNGAGGLSSSVGETAQFSGGCELHLDRVPLKYAGLDPWEILVSESQERMTIAVNPDKVGAVRKLADKHDVEMSVLGELNGSGKFHALYKGKTVAFMDIEFLHSGFPQMELEAEFQPTLEGEPALEDVGDHNALLLDMLARENIASKEWIERQYDHEVQGGSVLKPFIGANNDGPGDAAVIKPLLDRKEGLAIAAGINPKYSKIDAYHMTALALDEAIRKVVSVGASLDNITLNDNFCWPNSVHDAAKNPDGKHKLAQLVRANRALYEYTTAFETPCISGKDSMFIDSNLKDDKGVGHKISGLPTIQFTAVARLADVEKCVSMDAKNAGDAVYAVGETRDELGASEYYELLGFVGRNVPKLDKSKAKAAYNAVAKAIQTGLVASCHGCYRGGLGVALAQKALAGNAGLHVDLRKVPGALARDDKTLYSESGGRFVVTVRPAKSKAFEKAMAGVAFAGIGEVTKDKRLTVTGVDGSAIIDEDVGALGKAWRSTFGGW
jgi:phosphoribosylformylglycinamidine synthase